MKLLYFFLTAIIFLSISLLIGCMTYSHMEHTQTIPNEAYKKALEWTDPNRHEVPAEGSEAEAEMLRRMKSLFTNYTKENLKENVTKVYADKVYFRDAFKQLDEAEAIRDYFVHGLAPLNGAEFEFRRIIRSGGEFYVDWVMRLDFKKTPEGQWEESIGITHMRFNAEGQIIFHQDYWDPTDIVYKRIPIARQLINFVKKKM